MFVKQVENPKSSYEHYETEFDNYPPNTEVAIFDYGIGDYCGGGNMLIKLLNDDNWYIIYLDHCSCYGPEQGLDEFTPSEDKSYNIFNIENEVTPEFKDELNVLIDVAKEYMNSKNG